MDRLNYTSKREKGKHLNYEERIKIETLSKIGMKSEKIAAEIGCSGRTIRRELAKGRTELLNSDLTTRTEYSADRGQKSHDYAATAKGAMLKIGKDYKLVKEIERLIIKEKMSPYAAAQSIKNSGKFTTVLSYKTIYNYIDLGLFPNLTNKHLPVKKNGKNDISFFNADMQKDFLKRLSLETKLSIAVLNGSFQLYFQPQIDLHKNCLRGFEALIRWHDPEIGWISPADFIPVAEETKLIQTIGLWVLENCIATWKDWHAKYNFNGIMSINVSPVQLQKTEFLQDVSRLIAKYQVDPSKLEIEVTEGIFIDNSEEIIGQLRQIKNMGLGIALDDFGTGYSSLNYLQRIPLTVLKIDKSFVNNLSENDSVEKNITESIISLVNKMGLETIAEGIETIEQFTVLKKMNCDFIQGFLAGKPMSLQNCSQFLSGDFSVVQQVPEAGAITYSL